MTKLHPISTIAISFFVLGCASTLRAEIVVVHGDGKTPTLVSDSSEEVDPDASSYWYWTENRLPQRHLSPEFETNTQASMSSLSISFKFPEGFEINERTCRVTVFAGPIPMWSEVPEKMLPTWSSPCSKTAKVAVAPDAPWRIRVVGEGLSSRWIDTIGPAPVTASLQYARNGWTDLLDSEGNQVPEARVSVLTRTGPLDRFSKVTEYWSDSKGRVVFPNSPNLSKETLVVITAQALSPRVLETDLTDIPESTVLSEGATVSGVVVDAEGKGIPQATVRNLTWISPGVPVPFLRHATSDASGAWSISGLPPGTASLTVAAIGHVPSRREVILAAGEQSVGRWKLSEGAPIEVFVVDDRGDPVSQALVTPLGFPSLRTGASGSARFFLPPSSAHQLTARASGHVQSRVNLTLPLPSQATIRIERSVQLKGRLVHPEGLAIAEGRAKMTMGRSFSQHQLEPDGSFVLFAPPDRPVGLEFRSEQTAVTTLAVQPGFPGEIRDLGAIEARLGHAVSGRLVSADTAQPIQGAKVSTPRPSDEGELISVSFDDYLTGVSDSDGRFELRGFETGGGKLRITAAGYPRKIVAFEILENDADLGVVELQAGGTVTITLDEVDLQDPIARIDLAGAGLEEDYTTAHFSAGVATFTQLEEGEHIVEVWDQDRPLCEMDASVTTGEVTELSCKPELVTVHGRVTVGNQPRAGTLLWTRTMAEEQGSVIMNRGIEGLNSQEVKSSVDRQLTSTVDHGGIFGTLTITPGKWRIFFIEGTGSAMGPKIVEVPSSPVFDVTFSFEGLQVAGLVVGPGSQPLPGATVKVVGNAASWARSDHEGTFRLRGLAPGVHRIRASHGELVSQVQEVRLDADAQPANLVLRISDGLETIRIRVGPNRANPNTLVLVQAPGGLVIPLTTDREGIALLQRHQVDADRLRIAAFGRVGWMLSGWTQLNSHSEEIALREEQTGTLRVVGVSKLADVSLTSSSGWDFTNLWLWTRNRGIHHQDDQLLISGLPSGSYQIVSSNRSFEVTIREGKETVVDP